MKKTKQARLPRDLVEAKKHALKGVPKAIKELYIKKSKTGTRQRSANDVLLDMRYGAGSL